MRSEPISKLLVAATCFLGCAAHAFAAPCGDSKAVVFYVNGVLTSPADAESARLYLRNKISLELGCDIPVLLAYNTSVDALQDFHEALEQKFREEGIPYDAKLANLIIGGVIDYSSGQYGRLVVRTTQFFADTLLEFEGELTDQQKSDMAAHEGQYTTALTAGYHVVLVGHSQGNFVANLEFESLARTFPVVSSKMDVIGVATPSNHVAGDPFVKRYTTLRGDPIHHIFGALAPNAGSPDCEDDTLPGRLECHSFTTYLGNAEPWSRLYFHILAAARRAAIDDSYEMTTGAVLTLDQVTILSNDRIPVTVDSIEFVNVGNGVPESAGEGEYTYQPEPGFVGRVAFSYLVHTPAGRSNRATITIDVQPSSGPGNNQPPRAGFSLTHNGQVIHSPGTLNVSADSGTGEARIRFGDESTDPDRDPITSWDWTVNTQTGSLCTGTPICDWGFQPGGPYLVKLTVGDGHHQSTATATINVAPPPVTSTAMDDDFNGGNVIDSTRWNVVIDPVGAGSVSAANQRVEMVRSTPGYAYQALQGRCSAVGDFDVQVEFDLLNWPAQNFNTLRLAAMDLPGPVGLVGVYRNSYNSENYQMRAADGIIADIVRNDSSGILRLKRTGSTVQGFYWNGSSFVLLASTGVSTGPTRFLVDFASPSEVSPVGVAVAIDNFKLNSGTVLCPPAPVARNDAYAAVQGATLIVPAPGLLGNDSYPSGATIEFLPPFPPATLVNVFPHEGGFILDLSTIPTFTGTISMAYVIHTTFGVSNVATVTVDVRPPVNQPPTAGFSMSVPGQIVRNGATLGVTADPITNEARVTFADLSTDPDGDPIISRVWTVNTQTDPLSIGDASFAWGFTPGGPYIITLLVRDSAGNESTTTGTINVSPPAASPTARFTLRSGLLASHEGGILSVVVPTPTEEALVTMTDLSDPVEGVIISREWRVDTETEPLPSGDSAVTRGFRTDGPSARYTITLTVENSVHQRASAAAVLVVSSPTVFYTDPDPMVGLIAGAADSVGSLYYARQRYGFACGFGVCSNSLQKIVPTGGGWIRDALFGDVFASLGITVGPGDRVYFQGLRNRLYAFESDGNVANGLWPVDFESTANDRFATGTQVDADTGQVFLHTRPFGQFNSGPPLFKALRADGGEMWRLQDATLGVGFLGPARQVYRLISTGFAAYDRETGGVSDGEPVPLCEGTGFGVGLTSFIFGTGGIFAARDSTLINYGPDCSDANIFFDAGRDLTPRQHLAGMIIATDLPSAAWFFGYDPFRDPDLLGISEDGTRFWRNSLIAPQVARGNPVLGSFAGITYILGFDKTDNNNYKLFGVFSQTGEVMRAIPLEGICSQMCGLVVDRNGNLYLNESNAATPIFKIEYPY